MPDQRKLYPGKGSGQIGHNKLEGPRIQSAKCLTVAKLTALALEQTKHLAPIDVSLCNFLERQHPGEAENFINQLHQGPPEE